MARGWASRAAKAKARRLLGPLRKRTVQYDQALVLFKWWLRSELMCWPRDEAELSKRLADFVEILWEEGESKADLANLLSALHDAEPSVDPALRAARRLYHVWKRDELQEQSTPAKVEWVQALAGLALHWRWPEIALMLALSFWCLLRTSEAGNLRYGDAVVTKGSVALLKLGFTKSGGRKGRKEAVVCDREELVAWIQAAQEGRDGGMRVVPGGAKELRQKFSRLVLALGLQKANLRYNSLRRGGATDTFHRTGSFDVCAEAGRWGSLRTARIYIDSALQAKYEDSHSTAAEAKIQKAGKIYLTFLGLQES